MREVQRIKDRIYSDFDAELQKACEDDDVYDVLMTEKNGQAFF